MLLWKNDEELFEIARKELYTSVVGDIMDQMNYRHQFLSPRLQPLSDDMLIVGYAFPVLEADMDSDIMKQQYSHLLNKPFGVMLEALDALGKNDVYMCTGASPDYALWGELMSVRAKTLGAAGAIVDGYSRDTRGILELRFPTFSYGRYAQDQAPRGKVLGFNIPLEFGKVKVAPRDIVMADLDGVCVVPAELKEEVFTKALAKARGERIVYQEIFAGMSACEAFRKYEIM